jgi:hypothetical protein
VLPCVPIELLARASYSPLRADIAQGVIARPLLKRD